MHPTICNTACSHQLSLKEISGSAHKVAKKAKSATADEKLDQRRAGDQQMLPENALPARTVQTVFPVITIPYNCAASEKLMLRFFGKILSFALKNFFLSQSMFCVCLVITSGSAQIVGTISLLLQAWDFKQH